MEGLLDTHTAIWVFAADKRLSEKAKSFILDNRNMLFISIISVWEIAIKTKIGKLDFPGGIRHLLELMDKYNYRSLGVLPKHILELEKLPLHHRDPFDRLLVSSAIAENMPIITADRNMPLYPVKIIW